MSLRIIAPAKLNLFLHITGKRADGYHLLQSITFFSEFGDELDIAPAKSLSLHITGSMSASLPPDHSQNLVLRAAQLLQSHTGITSGAAITLHKHIPIGAGLGGGSSDAAATLIALNQFWNLALPIHTLMQLAAELGSDTPACLQATPAWVTGTGEHLLPITFPSSGWLLLLNPNQPLLTADVFRNYRPPFDEPITPPAHWPDLPSLATWASTQHNSLEMPAISIMPEIKNLLSAIASTEHCLLHRMSGSGATCFGLYASQAHAAAALKHITTQHPNIWATITPIKGAAHGQAQ